MNYRKIGLILLALLLAGMAMVPCVNAADTHNENVLRETIEANYVPVETALNQASFTLNEFVSSDALGERETWLGASVNPNPLVIHNTDGTRLFYLFTIEKNNRKIGEIKVAATKVIGNPVFTIGPATKSLDIPDLEQKVTREAVRYAKKDSPISTKLVSYAYPKIGIMAEYTDAQTNAAQKIIIDAYDDTIIPDRSPRYEGDRGIVSFYASYPAGQVSEFIDMWSKYDQRIREIGQSNPRPESSGNVVTAESLQSFAALSTATTEYNVLSPFTLYGQETSEWCTVGTAKMISQWFGVSRTQTAIAAKMGIPTSSPYRGATINEELTYYQGSISSGGLGKSSSLDYYTTYWDDSKDEIDNGRPFKVGNAGHARAVAGYIRSSSTGYTYFLFKDPYPVNQGSEYWEWFNELNPYFYNNHIKIQ